MSFQQALLDAQHGTLGMDEALALLDGFDLSTTCDQHKDCSDNDDDGSSSHISYSCRSSSTASSSSSDELSSATPDDSLFAQLSDSGMGEFSGADWEVLPHATLDQLLLEPQQYPAEPQPHNQPQQKKQEKQKKTTRARKLAAVPKVKKPRKHNRIEILKLRELVEKLQIQHADLQKSSTAIAGGALSVSVSAAVAAQFSSNKDVRKGNAAETASRSMTVSGAAPPRSVWLELAVEQYKQLQHSEGLNRKLRDAVSKQLKVTNSLQALLRKRVSPQDVELLLEAPPAAADVQSRLVNPQEQILAGLRRSVESQFHETGLVCHGISVANDVTSVFSASNAKQDAMRGPTFEHTTNAPVSSNFRLIGDLVWNRSIEQKSPSELQLTQTHLSRDFHEKRVQMSVPSRLGELQVDGVVVACKFEEAHRIVVTVASAYTVNGSCLVFRENVWLIVSESTGKDEERESWESTPSALFQTFVRSFSEKQDPRSATGSSPLTRKPDENTEYLQEVVTKVLANHIRQHMGAMQKALLTSGDSFMSSVMEFQCPLAGCTC